MELVTEYLYSQIENIILDLYDNLNNDIVKVKDVSDALHFLLYWCVVSDELFESLEGLINNNNNITNIIDLYNELMEIQNPKKEFLG